MTEFSTPRPNLYVASDGYSVEVLGRTGLAYRERGRCIFMDSEVLAPPAGIMLYQDTISRWEPPHQDEAVTGAERLRIVANVLAALGSQGIEIQVI